MSANMKIICACVQCMHFILSLHSLCLCHPHHCMIELQEVLADLKMLYTTDHRNWTLPCILIIQSSNRCCPRFPEAKPHRSTGCFTHRRELYVVGRSAGFSSKAAAGAAVSQRAAAGRPKRCGTSHALIWASNARQDTTFDTLQKTVILIYNHVPCFFLSWMVSLSMPF